MTHINRNEPPPVETPPPTFDIIGLYPEQIALLTALVGHALTKTHKVNTHPLYQELDRAMRADPTAREIHSRIHRTVELTPTYERASGG